MLQVWSWVNLCILLYYCKIQLLISKANLEFLLKYFAQQVFLNTSIFQLFYKCNYFSTFEYFRDTVHSKIFKR